MGVIALKTLGRPKTWNKELCDELRSLWGNTDLSVKDIASIMECSDTAIYRKRRELGLEDRDRVASGDSFSNISSICWRCKKCNPIECGWVREGQKVWDKAIEKVLGSSMGDYTVYLVTECSNKS